MCKIREFDGYTLRGDQSSCVRQSLCDGTHRFHHQANGDGTGRFHHQADGDGTRRFHHQANGDGTRRKFPHQWLYTHSRKRNTADRHKKTARNSSGANAIAVDSKTTPLLNAISKNRPAIAVAKSGTFPASVCLNQTKNRENIRKAANPDKEPSASHVCIS